MGAAAPASLGESAPEREVSSYPEPHRELLTSPQAVVQAELPPQISEVRPVQSTPKVPGDRLKSAVLQALTDGNQRILVSMLEAGEWSVEGNEVVIKVSESQTVVDMSLGADARRLAIASASGVLGRAVKTEDCSWSEPCTAGSGSAMAERENSRKQIQSWAAVAGPNRMPLSAGCRRNSAPKFVR